jgi:hypothetical protein
VPRAPVSTINREINRILALREVNEALGHGHGTRAGAVVVVDVHVAAQYDDSIARTMVRGSQ